MSNEYPLASRTFSRSETADFLNKIKQQMARDTEGDPLRNAIMNALCDSRDPRVAAIRRKSSFDQLHAIVGCVATAVEKATAKPEA